MSSGQDVDPGDAAVGTGKSLHCNDGDVLLQVVVRFWAGANSCDVVGGVLLRPGVQLAGPSFFSDQMITSAFGVKLPKDNPLQFFYLQFKPEKGK